MGRKLKKRTITTTTTKTVEINGKTYIEYSSGTTMQDFQNEILNCALKENDFNPSKAADSLKIGKSTVYRAMNLNSRPDEQ